MNTIVVKEAITVSDVYKKLLKCYDSVKEKVNFQPKLALVLGSGLGDYGNHIKVVQELDYSEIKGFPVSTVTGHAGKFLFGYVGDVPVVCMQGRVHYYEGYPMSDVVLPIRLMKLMGAEVLFLTNAAGGVNKSFEDGTLMMLTGHITSFIPSPLIGKNLDELGPRFPDMTEVYRKNLQELIRSAARKLDFPLKEGVYLQFTGPCYETPEEVQLAKLLGADAVGMSTACEAAVANHMGMKVCGISCITNMAAGISLKPLSHEEVKETADRVASAFTELVTESIVRIGATL